MKFDSGGPCNTNIKIELNAYFDINKIRIKPKIN